MTPGRRLPVLHSERLRLKAYTLRRQQINLGIEKRVSVRCRTQNVSSGTDLLEADFGQEYLPCRFAGLKSIFKTGGSEQWPAEARRSLPPNVFTSCLYRASPVSMRSASLNTTAASRLCFRRGSAGNQVLHYFDNFPTAAVVTRATRLRIYLARRIARGEISMSDDVILVGHSTGGLDIRRLLWDLHHRRQPIVVDGGAKVEPARILKCVRRVVFLSVPHWGTNIADWVHAYGILRKALVEEFRAAVAGSQLLLLDEVESLITGGAACLTGAELFRAAQDALSEANEHNGRPSPMRTLEAQDAASQLALYLRHMASDFRAIDDLTSRPQQPDKPVSPAHFGRSRSQERTEAGAGHRISIICNVGEAPVSFRSRSASATVGACEALDLC